MKLLLLAVFALALVAGTANAQAWKPGTPYYVSEEDASSSFERAYDHAYCRGIPRFGKRGRFPYEEYLRFDCTTTDRRYGHCTFRARSVKGARRGYFRMRFVRGTLNCTK